MRLAVELHGLIIGQLAGDPRSYDFSPSEEAVDRYGLNSPMLSVAIPLSFPQRRAHASRRRNWFSELLPEGDQYAHMLQQGNLRPGDTLGFLAKYGRDMAGALQIWDLDDPTEPQTPSFMQRTGGRIVGTGTRWFPEYTHSQTAAASVIFDEEYGSRIARRLNLAAFATEIVSFHGLPTLVIERYDRNSTGRVHQEDFNQVLGASANEKYQELGGVASLRRVADTLTRHSTHADLQRLAQMLIMAVATGNLDMHTKNIGLLHLDDGSVQLAPAYDAVPQSHMSNDGRLALAVNKKYALESVTAVDLEAELRSWGVRRAAKLIESTLDEIAAVVVQEAPLAGAFSGLQPQILGLIERLRGSK